MTESCGKTKEISLIASVLGSGLGVITGLSVTTVDMPSLKAVFQAVTSNDPATPEQIFAIALAGIVGCGLIGIWGVKTSGPAPACREPAPVPGHMKRLPR